MFEKINEKYFFHLKEITFRILRSPQRR